MKITIYGSGCAKCKQLTDHAEQAAQRQHLDYEIEKITDTNAIIDAGILRTPALALDDDIVIEGKVASIDDVEAQLRQRR
jgi:small redox-active disulfide protein 2